jgi:hypothetical protein
LSELDPHWVTEEFTERAGFICRCPCGACDDDRRLYVPLKNPLGPGPVGWRERGWLRVGEDFATLTLMPSIRRLEGCQWHGVLEGGVFVTVP